MSGLNTLVRAWSKIILSCYSPLLRIQSLVMFAIFAYELNETLTMLNPRSNETQHIITEQENVSELGWVKMSLNSGAWKECRKATTSRILSNHTWWLTTNIENYITLAAVMTGNYLPFYKLAYKHTKQLTNTNSLYVKGLQRLSKIIGCAESVEKVKPVS